MKKIEQIKKQALNLMASGGFPVKAEVLIEIDNRLPFMGYTTEREGKTLIVVSGWSLKSNMSMGLIIHELSHVYRIESAHPSHNFALHNKVLQKLCTGKRVYPFQQEILFNIINTLQDLYADDISFKVYIRDSQKDTLNEFFLGWVREPLGKISNVKDVWKSMENVINAAFAQANLERHGIKDTGGKIEKAIKAFLTATPKKQSEKYTFFKNMMINLPEHVTNDEFEILLTKYLNEFLVTIRDN